MTTFIRLLTEAIMRQPKKTLEPEVLDAVFAFICQHNEQFGYSPNLREIAEATFMSRPNLYRYLDRLEAAGRIIRTPGVARGITIVKTD